VLRISPRALAALSTPAAALLIVGCSSGPGRVEPPSISASGAASEAIELYDKDSDGFIAGAELDAVPGIKAAMTMVDSSNDGKVSVDEIEARISAWQDSNIGVMAIKCTATLDGRPLTDAVITFEPESFLGDDVKAGVGDMGASGSAMMSIPKDQRPTQDTPPGMQLGFYRVRISKKSGDKETIPPQYNVETTLGQEVAPDDPAIAGQKVRFELKTK
jgi:hypothetical protein